MNKIPHILRLGDGTEKSSGKIKPIEKIKALETKPGLYTNHKPIIDKDRKSLERMIKDIQGNFENFVVFGKIPQELYISWNVKNNKTTNS